MGLEPGVRFPFFHHSESSDWPVWVALWGLTQTSLCEGKIWRVYTRLCVVTDPCVNSHGDVVPGEKWPCLRGGAKTSKLLCDWLCIFLWVCVGAREVLQEWFSVWVIRGVCLCPRFFVVPKIMWMCGCRVSINKYVSNCSLELSIMKKPLQIS